MYSALVPILALGAYVYHYISWHMNCSPGQVWGSKAEGAVHSPPDNIIWKGADNWGSGEKTVTKLVSPSGDVSGVVCGCGCGWVGACVYMHMCVHML